MHTSENPSRAVQTLAPACAVSALSTFEKLTCGNLGTSLRISLDLVNINQTTDKLQAHLGKPPGAGRKPAALEGREGLRLP